jgi:hypothetical protein
MAPLDDVNEFLRMLIRRNAKDSSVDDAEECNVQAQSRRDKRED